MKKEHSLSILVILGIWYVLSKVVANDIIIPTIESVVTSFITIVVCDHCLKSILITLSRVFIIWMLSLISALLMALMSDKYVVVRRFFEPLHTMIKAIPTISYLIVCLLWFGSEKSVHVVAYFLLFPIFYQMFLTALQSESADLKDVFKVYPENWWDTFRLRTLPLLKLSAINAGKTAFSMGLKAVVMAEILSQVKDGIGKRMSLAKLDLDTSSIVAWTIIILLISKAFEVLLEFIYKNFLIRRTKEWKS